MMDYEALAARGFAVAKNLIDPADCRALAALWPDQARFRKHIVMQRHGYGQGEYQYFAYPLPEPVERLRQALYPELARVANAWNEQLGRPQRFPPTLKGWLQQCHEGGQQRPTPLLLRYGPGDYAGPHNDHHPENKDARSGYVDLHLSLCGPGVAHQWLVYSRAGHFSEIVSVAKPSTVTAYRLPFWHYTTPLVGKPSAARWVLLGTFLYR